MPGCKQKRGEGTWRLIVTVGSDYTGKPRRFTKTVHCRSEREADEELALFYADCRNGRMNSSKPVTIEQLCDLYQREYADRFLKKSSAQSISSTSKIWIIPKLGSRKIARLTRPDVQMWVNSISDAGRSPKTVRNCYSVLRGLLAYAVDMGLLDVSPCQNIRMPKKEKKEARSYMMEEVQQLLKALEALPAEDLCYKCAVLLGLFSGMRKGELLGLNWEDIDMDTGQLHIQRTRMIGRGIGVYESTPKTDKSDRYITVPAIVLTQLRRLRAQQLERKLMLAAEYKDDAPVLQGRFGGSSIPTGSAKVVYSFLQEE